MRHCGLESEACDDSIVRIIDLIACFGLYSCIRYTCILLTWYKILTPHTGGRPLCITLYKSFIVQYLLVSLFVSIQGSDS